MFERRRLLSLRSTICRSVDECKNMTELKRIHAHLITSPFLSKDDRFFLTTRLLFFCTTSSHSTLAYAEAVFKSIPNPNLFTYNAMIRAYSSKINAGFESGSPPMALILYKQMLCNGISPDGLTFPFIVKVCAQWGAIGAGLSIHSHVLRFGHDNDLFIQNSLISFYSAGGFLGNARYLFDGMSIRDVVSWNSIIIGCLRNGDIGSASELFGRMEERSIFTWNSMITGLVQAGQPREALETFQEMLEVKNDAVRPDKMTLASALAACAALGAMDHGKWVHGYLKRSGMEWDVVIGTALVDMYGKCGCVEAAVEVFREMARKDILVWTAMIAVFALHGYCEEAFDILKEMESEGVRPNHVTFIGLLSACAHSGSIEKGHWCFYIMRHVYLIEPQVQHYACMVDVLSRAGCFDEAERLIKSMPMEPDVFVWGALLGGCQMHGNVELGEKVATYLINLEPLNHAFYINLCDIYARIGRLDKVRKIRTVMEEGEIKKVVPGCSMIEVDGIVYEFSARGSAEVVMYEVLCLLSDLGKAMKMYGCHRDHALKPEEAEFFV